MVHGKSTLIKLLTGIIKPKHGKVLIEGKNTKDKKQEAEIRKDVGLVFQNPENQLVFSNIEDDMKFMLENFGFTKQEINRRINQALELVGMSEYINKETHTLSMGQKQRIAIAEMLALEPKYLVLDEPTAMLDPVSKTKLINTIKNLNKDKEVTVIYATNVISEILSADRIIALHKGKIYFECTPQTILKIIDKFKQIGLQIPQLLELIYLLDQRGIHINTNNFDVIKH